MSTTQNSGRPNGAPYLRTSREFPEDPKKLTLQISKSYIEIANAVNSRTISIFPISNSAFEFLRKDAKNITDFFGKVLYKCFFASTFVLMALFV